MKLKQLTIIFFIFILCLNLVYADDNNIFSDNLKEKIGTDLNKQIDDVSFNPDVGQPTANPIQFPETEKKLNKLADSFDNQPSIKTTSTAPLVKTSAKSFGFIGSENPLGRVFLLIAKFFDFSILKQNPKYVSAFLRLLFFILLLTVYRKLLSIIPVFNNDNKTVSIIAGVLGIISVFMMPEAWLMMNGGMVAVVAGLILPLGITAGAIYFAYTAIQGNSVPMKIIALLFILIAIMFVQMFRNIAGVPLVAPLFLFIPKKIFSRWVK